MVVGGMYLAQLDLVSDTVDSIRQETERVPSAVFLLTDDKFDVDLLKVAVGSELGVIPQCDVAVDRG